MSDLKGSRKGRNEARVIDLGLKFNKECNIIQNQKQEKKCKREQEDPNMFHRQVFNYLNSRMLRRITKLVVEREIHRIFQRVLVRWG